MCSGRLFRPRLRARRRIDVEAELGGDHDLVAERRQRLADEFLVGERAVDLGGVEEGDAALDGRADQRDRLPASRRPDRSRSSGPCSRGRWPRLPGCCFQVCAFALSSSLDDCSQPSGPILFVADLFHPVDGLAVELLPEWRYASSPWLARRRASASRRAETRRRRRAGFPRSARPRAAPGRSRR